MGFASARRKLNQGAPCRVPVLALEDNLRIVRVLRLIHSEDDDRPVVPDNVPSVNMPVSLSTLSVTTENTFPL